MTAPVAAPLACRRQARWAVQYAEEHPRSALANLTQQKTAHDNAAVAPALVPSGKVGSAILPADLATLADIGVGVAVDAGITRTEGQGSTGSQQWRAARDSNPRPLASEFVRHPCGYYVFSGLESHRVRERCPVSPKGVTRGVTHLNAAT